MRKTVLATGVFDILHPGHVLFLKESKRRAGRTGRLIVVVARDRTVLRRKGTPPILPEEERRQIVANLKPVDKAVLGYSNMDLLRVLRLYKPDVVAFGYDQYDMMRRTQKTIRENNLKIKVVRISRYGRRGLDSSASLKRRIANSLLGEHLRRAE